MYNLARCILSDDDEKRLMLFDMQEHPEKYTDEQVADLLADAEVKEFLRDMAMARMAVKKANPQKVDVDEAWKESFCKKHHHCWRFRRVDISGSRSS
jgi:hypothetical protein